MKDQVGRICTMQGRVTECVQIYGLKPGNKRLPSRLEPRWEDNNKLDLKAIG